MSSSGDDKIIAVLEIRSSEDEAEHKLYLSKISYHLISDDFPPAAVDYSSVPSGVEVNICRGAGECLHSSSSHLSNGTWNATRTDFSNSGMTVTNQFSLRARVPNKPGKFKVSIDKLEYIGENSGHVYAPQGLPFVTPEIIVQ